MWPESGWNLGGSVSTAAIRGVDLLVTGFFVLMVVGMWKMAPEVAAKEVELSAGGIFGSAVFQLVLAGIVPLVLWRRVNVVEFFGLRWLEWRRIFYIVPVFLVLMTVAALLLQASGWPEWTQSKFGAGSQESVRLLGETREVGVILAMVFAAVIVAPIAEEVIFRGYLYPVVKCFSEKWFAGLFTAMLFGVAHVNLMGFPMLVLIGLVLAILYEKTGSLWPSILCHMAFNGMTVVVIFSSR